MLRSFLVVVLAWCALASSAGADSKAKRKAPPVNTKALIGAKTWIATMIASKSVVTTSAKQPVRTWIYGSADSCSNLQDGERLTKPAQVTKLKTCLQDQTRGRTLVNKDLKQVDVGTAIGPLPGYLHKDMRAAAKGTTIIEAEFEGDDNPVIYLAVAGDGSVRVVWVVTDSTD